MTADQGNKGIPDDLLFSDTCTIKPPIVEQPSVHEEFSHALDQQTQDLPSTSPTMLTPSLDIITEVEIMDMQVETESVNLLVDAPAQTVYMGTNTVEGGDVGNLAHVAQFGNEDGSISELSTNTANDDDVTARSEPTRDLNSDVSDGSTNKGIVEHVVPENVPSQDVKVDNQGSVCTIKSQDLSKAIPTSLPMMPEHSENVAEFVPHSFDHNSLDLTSTKQESPVLESKEDENILLISDRSYSMQTQGQSPSQLLNRESAAVGNIPDKDFKTDRTREIPRGVDKVCHGEIVCNSDVESLAVSHNDREIVEETTQKTDPKISAIAQDPVGHTNSGMSDFTRELSCKTDPEIQGIQEPLYNLTDELNKPDTLFAAPVLRQSFTQPSSSELSDNNLEGNDSVLILDQAIPNPDAIPEDSTADSSANLLENVLTQTPQSLLTESQLDIMASENYLQDDPVTDRNPHISIPMPKQVESMASHTNDPVMSNMMENSSDTHLLISGFLQPTIKTPLVSQEAERDLTPLDLCFTPGIAQDLDCSLRDIQGDCLEVTDARYSNENPELWVDACQFLALEEDKGSIFDEWGHSPAPSSSRASPDNTKPWTYSQGRGDMIGQLGDWELPPVERWSSSDSWASALSDWFQTVSVLPENTPLGATKTSRSNSINQPLPCIGIQGSKDEQKESQESPPDSGQLCLPPSPTEVAVDSQSSRVPKDDNSVKPLLQLADKDMYLHAQSYTPWSQDLPDGSVDTQNEIRLKGDSVNSSGDSVPILQDEMTVSGPPYTTGKPTNQLIHSSKLESDEVRKETGDRTSQFSRDFVEQSVRNNCPLMVSGFSSDKDPTTGGGSVPCLDTYTSQLDTHVPSETEHLTRAESVEADCLSTSHILSHIEGIWTPECFHKQDSQTSRLCRTDDPVFIMPFAPVSIGTSFQNPCNLNEEQPCPKSSLKPSLIGISDEVRVASIAGISTSSEESSDDQIHTCSQKTPEIASSARGDLEEISSEESKTKIETQKASDISCELSKLILLTGQRFIVSEEKRVAYVTLDLDDFLNFNKVSSDETCDQGVPPSLKLADCEEQVTDMPHKTHKASSESKPRSKHKEKTTGQQLGTPAKKQGTERSEAHAEVETKSLGPDDGKVTVFETIVITEKIMPKSQGKKKKKHGTAKPESEHLAEVQNGAKAKGAKVKSEVSEATPPLKSGKVREKPALPHISTLNSVSADSPLKASITKQQVEPEAIKANAEKPGKSTLSQEPQRTCLPSALDDDLIKRRRISAEKKEGVSVRTRPQLPAIFQQKKEEEVVVKKAYSEVVKQKIQTTKEVIVPRVVAEIQAAPVPDDPQSISLWCQFSPVAADSSITWTKEGKVLSEKKRGVADESRVTLSILKACSKDLGMYRCSLTSSIGSVFTSDYHLTSEVLMELVIPSHSTPEPREVNGEEEDVHCAPLFFRDDILTDQYFGENQAASIVTEKVHFGEGMHRKAFRTTLQAGMMSTFNPGHPCVLKVHNAISYGTNNNEELVQKNYNLAVEECHVQNTAREYIKAYTNAAKSTESFGEVPEIIPIYLVHRPSNDIPYATLEEELIGDFVKYSVRDGKEINLMRRDSEAGQKCCAFQHWVYTQTEGNLLVTDMQGVGMKLTDVGIATCKKGYKGFKGNCSTSFIDQFKALHQCNPFCELLGLTSLQPKPKRTVAPPKPKTQPVPKKKTFGPVLKSKS
ncbi:alpha-protein kinase 2 [Hoplias malabaricus]|uniref:alpha-protein kinase 2 n=1 Tax=Hoplias malabaricus TaxID=27720 RepID=UPI003462A036